MYIFGSINDSFAWRREGEEALNPYIFQIHLDNLLNLLVTIRNASTNGKVNSRYKYYKIED